MNNILNKRQGETTEEFIARSGVSGSELEAAADALLAGLAVVAKEYLVGARTLRDLGELMVPCLQGMSSAHRALHAGENFGLEQSRMWHFHSLCIAAIAVVLQSNPLLGTEAMDDQINAAVDRCMANAIKSGPTGIGIRK